MIYCQIPNYQIIDAQKKGNWSRFMNHSCNPNCVLQKWIVAGGLRVGMFAFRPIAKGQELTFDYKFERYGFVAFPANNRANKAETRPRNVIVAKRNARA